MPLHRPTRYGKQLPRKAKRDQLTMFNWIVNPCSNILQHPNPNFKPQAIHLLHEYNRGYHYLGTVGSYCYFCDEDYWDYYAFSPLHNNQKVGQLSLDDEHYLVEINVEQNFRRQGIGTELIRFANETNRHPDTNEPRLLFLWGGLHSRVSQHPHDRQLSSDAVRLIDACTQKGIIQDDQKIGTTPMHSPAYSANSVAVQSPPRSRRSPHRYPQRARAPIDRDQF